MKIISFLFTTLVVLSCKFSKETKELSRGEEIFINQLLAKKESIKDDQEHLVFILNISSCQPCEDKVNAFITSDKWNNLNKTFIITNERAPIIKEKEGFISFERKDLLSYGLLRANGTVLLMKNGKCILIESIDINHIENLEKKITDLLKL